MNNKIILTEKVGKLTPVKSLNKKDNRRRILWLFKCDCGNQCEISASDVKLNRVLSCGCLQREHVNRLSKSKILPDKGGVKNKLFKRYIKEAENRGYEFSLTKEEFFVLINGNCFYCGQEPSNKMYNTVDKNPDYMIVYSGIDRLDNCIGYTNKNSVSCCYICNKMKLNLDSDQFLKQVEKIYLKENNELQRNKAL